MSYTRIALAALGAFVAYFALGGLFFNLPAMRNEFLKVDRESPKAPTSGP